MAKTEGQAWRRHEAALQRIRDFGAEAVHKQLIGVVEAARVLSGLLDRLEVRQRVAVLVAAGFATAELRGMARGLKAFLDSGSGAMTPGEAGKHLPRGDS